MSPEGSRTVRGAAHAKVNLGLAVTGRRPDGYHELRSVFLRVALADDLAVGLAPPGRPDSLVVEDDPDCPVDGNLVLRAVTLLRVELAASPDEPSAPELPGLGFRLRKRIPMGGGLAGGSADGATALGLALAAWGRTLLPARRLAIAIRLGADVPFCASGTAAALVEGIGERVSALPALRTRVGLLLVTPSIHVATPEVFGAFDRRTPAGRGATSDDAVSDLAAALAAGLDGPALAARAAHLRDANDLWPAASAVAPPLSRLRSFLERRLGRPVLLTGSGATLVALYPSPSAARAAAAMLQGDPADELRAVRIIATSDQPVGAPLEGDTA